ncbi:MAG: glycosyltransferase family 4 protein [Planctomycetota bacterium]|nr:glycosyltransferase family 4 protein [Planctomycetota bacterium]
MKILYNATTNAKGGSAQRATSFVTEAIRDPRGHQWCLAISPAQADAVTGCPPEIDVHVFEEKPSQDRHSRKLLRSLEARFRPDCVYSQLGPAYVRFQSPHLMGVADAWVTHPSLRAFRTLSFPIEWIQMVAAGIYKTCWLTQANAYVVETEYARQSFHRLHLKSLSTISVVPNTCGRQYTEKGEWEGGSFTSRQGTLRILTFAAPYPHKRLEIIPQVAAEIVRQKPDLDFRCVITLPQDCRELASILATAEKLGVLQRIENWGVIPTLQGPEIYRQCDACFLPTVLETFSASYPESMAMGVPMVTTDLGFAHDVCKTSALYFEPDNARDAAEKLLQALLDQATRRRLIESGRAVLAQLPSAERQYQIQVDLIEAFVRDRLRRP